jgi:uncharacterized protein
MTDNIGLTNAIIGFAQFARRKGLNIGIEESLTALKTLDYGVFENKAVFYYTLKTLFCTAKEDIPIFDHIFKIYWEANQSKDKIQSSVKKQGTQKKANNVLVALGEGDSGEEDENEDTKTVTGANAVQRLRKTDFSKVADIDTALLEQIAEQLWREMSKRLKRRMKAANKNETVDIRRTIRASLQHGGDPIELVFKGQKPKKMRLVVLLDVSGSMDKYSFFLLRFICSLQSYFEKVESFIFSTELRYITDFIKQKGLENTLKLLSEKADNWSSGTKIGLCLRDFNEKYAKTMLSRSSFVIILSDGLDTGDKGIIEAEMQTIRRRTKRLIWLNPLKNMQGYEPTARGMSEAFPHINVFESGHNLDSILELEKFLINV